MKTNTSITAFLLAMIKTSSAAVYAEAEETECEEDITTWPDCLELCTDLADGNGFNASHEGGIGNISRCICDYGLELENYYACWRTPTPPPPFPVPEEREVGGTCADQDITNQEECFAFCQEYKRFPVFVGSEEGFVACQCKNGMGGNVDWSCHA
jgi:hypothetical protein